MRMKIKYSELIGTLVILFALIGNQSTRLFGISYGFLFKVLYFSKYILCFLFIAYYLTHRRSFAVTKNVSNRFLKLSIPLFALMILTECLALGFSEVPQIYGVHYWSRSLFVFIDRFCIWTTCFLMWKYIGKKSLDCITRAVVADAIIILVCALIRVGISGIANSFLSILADTQENFFEVHELTFAIGMLIIYYLFFDAERRSNKKLLVFFLTISFLLGDKRIGIFAIVVAGIFALFVRKRGLSKKSLATLGSCGILICMLYIALIYNSVFFAMLLKYNISSSGRDIIFGYFTRRTTFGISQMGWGIAGISKVIENWDASEVMYMQSISGLHNDILATYISYGIIGSILWFAYYLLYLPNRFFSKFSKRTATIYMAMVLYLFVTYLTDNTADYFVCQVLLLLIPLSQLRNS